MRIWQHPKPSFPAWPANTSRCKSYYNLQQDNSFHSGASRPIPPATILSIPAPQSSISQLPSSRLGRPTPYIPSYHFFNIHKASSSHQVSLPTILLKSTNKNLSKTSSRRISVIFPDITTHHSTHLLFSIFPFSISSPTSSRPSSFRTSNSNLIPHFPNALHFFRPAAASPTRRPNAKRSFARGCSLQGCRWCGRGARVSFFSFFFLFFSASLFSLSFLISLAPRLRRDAFIFLFAFVFLFIFSFCFFLFIFLLIFYSCFSLSFLFTFSFFTFSFIFIFCLSFCFTFYPPHSNLFPHYPTARRPFVFSPPPPIFTILSSHFRQRQKGKNIGKRIHGGEMASRERTSGGRKDRGTEWSPERDGKKCILRGMEQWAERNEWREEID